MLETGTLSTWLARRLKRRTSHKKACVALARKLAVVPHRMWVSGEDFVDNPALSGGQWSGRA